MEFQILLGTIVFIEFLLAACLANLARVFLFQAMFAGIGENLSQGVNAMVHFLKENMFLLWYFIVYVLAVIIVTVAAGIQRRGKAHA